MNPLPSHTFLAAMVALLVALPSHAAYPADPDAAVVRLLAELKKQGLEFSALKDNRRSIELAVPNATNRTHVVYLFAPRAAVIFGQRYITLYGFAAPSKGVDTLKALNQANASTVLGTWFVGQNGLLTYKMVVPDSIQPAGFKNLVLLVAGASDAKEKEMSAKDQY